MEQLPFTLESEHGCTYQPSWPSVVITTDGGCHPNPGNGGWAAILRFSGAVKEISGFERNTTNNRMEMIAFIEAVKRLNRPCNILLRTDSMILIYSVRCGGKKMHKRKNQDLVREILDCITPHQVKTLWVKGHMGDRDNERCDALCAEQIKKHTK